MSGPSDTDRSPPPDDSDMLDAVAADLRALAGVARGLGDGLDELVQRLQQQAEERREGKP